MFRKKYGYLALMIFVFLIVRNVAAANQDDPALRLSSQEEQFISRFETCVPVEVGSRGLTDYFDGLPLNARPDVVIPTWFEFFKQEDYNGLFVKLWRASRNRSDEWDEIVQQIQAKIQKVKQTARQAPNVIQLVDLGSRAHKNCQFLGYPIMELVEQQHDFAMAWVKAMTFATRNELRLRDIAEKRRELTETHQDLMEKYDNIRALR